MTINYWIIFILFIFIICVYFYIQKPKSIDIFKVYDKYLLTTLNPVRAFTYKKLGENLYENYQFEVDSVENTAKLVKYIDPYPINGSGSEYIEKDHGNLTEISNGFTIDGVESEFTCPVDWLWDTNNKTCTVGYICEEDDANYIKGLTLYQFEAINNEKEKQFHKKLYAYCLDDKHNYRIEECPDNKLYNNVEKQEYSEDVCQFYDICSEHQDYYKHTEQIDDYVLKDNEYYLCVDSKSNLKECTPPLVFNTSINSCISQNLCFHHEDGYTFYVDDSKYIYCYNQQDVEIPCLNGVYSNEDNTQFSCKIMIEETYLKYAENENLWKIPIQLCIYKNNQKLYEQVEEFDEFLSVELPEQDSTTTPYITNKLYLYEPLKYNLYGIDYLNEEYSDFETFNVDKTILKRYAINPYTLASYHDCIPSQNYNVLEDQFMFNTSDEIYYKDGLEIKSIHSLDVKNSIDYIFFYTSEKLFTVKNIIRTLNDDVNGFVIYYNTKLPRNYGFPIVACYNFVLINNIPDSTVITIFFNHTTNSLDVLEFDNSEGLVTNEYAYESNNFTPKSKYIKSFMPDLVNNETTFQLSPFNYPNIVNDNIKLRPHCMFPLNFHLYLELENKFNILYSFPITEFSSMVDVNNKIDEVVENLKINYNRAPKFTGSDLYFKLIINDIYLNFIDEYID